MAPVGQVDYDALAQKYNAGAGSVDYDALAQKHGAQKSAAQEPSQPSTWDVLTQPTEKTDSEFMGYTGLPGVAGATLHGLNNIARGTAGAVKGIGRTIAHPIDTARELVSGIADAPSQVRQIPAAVRDINASPDPISHYADAAEDTAAQGAGQALTALGTEGIVRGIAPVTRLGARTAETAINQKVIPVRSILNLNTPADEAAAVRIKVPGRDFGIAKPVYPGASLPEHPGVFPGASLPEDPGVFSKVPLGPEHPGVFSKVPLGPEMPAPEQLNPSLISPSRSLPGQIGPEVIRPRIASIPPRPGLILPPGQAGSMVESVAPPGSGDPILDRLRANAARIAEEGHGDEAIDEPESTPITTNLNDDLTPALKASLRKVRAAKRIAAASH